MINGKTSIDTVDVDDLAAEAQSWGMSSRRGRMIATSCIEDVRDVVGEIDLPDGAEHVMTNLRAMWKRRAWSVRS